MSRPDPGVRPDRRLRTMAGGRYLVGGTPRRFLKLADTGGRRVAEWFSGRGRPVTAAELRLADRLVEGGLAHPRRPPPATGRPIDVVIPVLDDPAGLAVTLASLTEITSPNHAGLRVTVVDDGSRIPVRLPATIDGVAVNVLRHRANRGPAAARNTGLDAAAAPLILFVDAGVRLAPGTVDGLAAWLEDPRCSAAAPRIRSSSAPSWVGRYELGHSPLDPAGRAGDPVVVGPGKAVSYVPSTAILVDRSALAAGDRFDEDLRFGEDVDLVWRIGRTGWVVLDPGLLAWHQPRPTVAAMARQRFAYGTSAGPLARRHGRSLAPLVLGASFGLAGAAVTALPPRWAAVVAVAALSADARRNGRRLHQATSGWPGAFALGVVETVGGWIASTGGVIRFSTRVGWPVAALLIGQPVSRRLRRRAILAVVARAALAVRASGVGAAPLALVDDLAYGAGVWVGAVRSGQPVAVVPRLVRKR